MATKTGRAWLGKNICNLVSFLFKNTNESNTLFKYVYFKLFFTDCDNPAMAETSLDLAEEVSFQKFTTTCKYKRRHGERRNFATLRFFSAIIF